MFDIEELKDLVVDIRNAPYDLYIGRHNGWKRLKKSKWHNPYKPEDGSDQARHSALLKYCDYLKAGLIDEVYELRNVVLGCWCAPQACHGHVLVFCANAENPREALDALIVALTDILKEMEGE